LTEIDSSTDGRTTVYLPVLFRGSPISVKGVLIPARMANVSPGSISQGRRSAPPARRRYHAPAERREAKLGRFGGTYYYRPSLSVLMLLTESHDAIVVASYLHGSDNCQHSARWDFCGDDLNFAFVWR
jgi:hypothetical protein